MTEHCDSPCSTDWIDTLEGEHDWASVDENGREHCAHCPEEEYDQ